MTRLRSRRLLIPLVGVVLAALAIGFWWLRRTPEATATTQQSIVTVSTSTLSQSVSASGTINPKVQSNLRFTSSGSVTAVNVKVGDTVTAGQPVATIDPTDLRNALDLAQANANSAASALSTAKSSSTTTSAQLAAANSQVAAANAKLATAQTALASATLTSPIAGAVASVNVAVGDQVSGGGTSSGGSGSAGGSAAGSSGSSAQIVVITTDAWTVATSVSSADLPMIKPGLQAQITPTGARQPVFGTVSTVGVIATTTSGVATFPVTIAVTGSPAGLYAGATATVSIIVREVADALTVPTSAIRTSGGQTTVLKVVDGQQVSTPVTIGMVQGNLTQITKGMAEGDQVVVESRAGAGGGSGSTGTRTRGTGATGGAGGFGGSGGFAPGNVPGNAPGNAPAGAPGGGQCPSQKRSSARPPARPPARAP